MSRKFVLTMSIACFAIGLFISKAGLAEKTNKVDSMYKELELFSDAVSIIRSDYVEEPKEKDLIYGALKGMLSSLDPYSQFMDPETYNEMKIETEGEFGGIGIEITIQDNLLTIITPIDDTPAFKIGLKAGDKIVKIEGEITKDLTLIEAVKKLRGKPGTIVNITVLRESEKKLLDFAITRSIIKLESIKKAEIIESGIGYIRLAEFQEKTQRDLETSLNKLERDGIKGLILDLRNNPGGLLDSAVDVSGKFLEEGQVVVSTRGRVENQNLIFKSRNKNKHLDYPLVVLVNGGSASASEIVAGAIQDNRRGLILGTKSFGKGSVQTVVPMSDGSAVRLTTSKYFTPNGRSIHGEGITPDIVVEYKDRPEEDEKKDNDSLKMLEGLIEVEKTAEEKEEDKKKEYDNQVVSAIDVLRGIIIFNSK
ncbi:MAG: S41 family peptidase [Candidatus Omnitrophica bacterium]|nr:S41 family peptidase [Candidatus Omnitrophota bacterium]MBU4149088.1 S41 family peptidase [Candidatus Omnitrophota bacterium]